MLKTSLVVVLLVACVLLNACTQDTRVEPVWKNRFISGLVTDVDGQPLPGVGVRTENGPYFTQTSARGKYSIRYAPGQFALTFIKTGYTSGRLEFDLGEEGRVEATTLMMWRLPPTKGVYSLAGPRYTPLPGREPEEFNAVDGGLVFGFRTPDRSASFTAETISLMGYHIPSGGLTVHRLGLIKVKPPDQRIKADTIEIWAPVEEIPVSLTTIDEPDGRLYQATPTETLSPGLYAVSYGVLAGRQTSEPRVFTFTIVPPPAEEAPPAETELTTEEESTDEEPVR